MVNKDEYNYNTCKTNC